MKIHLAQLTVERDLPRNLGKLVAALETVQAGEWIVFPEAVLSGYFPEDDDYVTGLDAEEIRRSVAALHTIVRDCGCHCLLGTAWPVDSGWQNAGFLLSPADPPRIYAKIQLSALDRRHFQPGADLPVFEVNGARVGIQLCRDLLFPDQWSVLRQAGANLVVHLNNAIQPHDAIWRHVLITRALEHAMYVCSVNNAASPQELTSYLVGPDGSLLLAADPRSEQVLSATIDASAVVPDVRDRTDF
jgi:predicted amidohydrolase